MHHRGSIDPAISAANLNLAPNPSTCTSLTITFHNYETGHLKMATEEFKPALIVVDLQEDFCPPVSHLYLLVYHRSSFT
jgi:hypothetical protein